jgi:hypothetical protein
MGPYVALEVRGLSVRLDLPTELGKIEQRDSDFTDFEAPVRPVRGGDGTLRYEIHRIWGHRPPGKLPAKEYLVQLKGYDTSQMTWVARASLLADVPTFLQVYEASPTTDQARKSAPKRAPTAAPLPLARRRSARIAAS